MTDTDNDAEWKKKWETRHSQTPIPSWWSNRRLKPISIGEEAVLSPRDFSLEGRAIRKVRQSVSRLCKAGYGFRIVAADEWERTEQLAEGAAVQHGIGRDVESATNRPNNRKPKRLRRIEGVQRLQTQPLHVRDHAQQRGPDQRRG